MNVCDAGCNLICTSLHKVLHRLFELHVPSGTRPHIGHFSVQVDNCISENKNHILLGYLGSLVAQGVIGEVEIQFMPVGHTHIKIDQVFSRYVYGTCSPGTAIVSRARLGRKASTAHPLKKTWGNASPSAELRSM